jgi:hypothetical protein
MKLQGEEIKPGDRVWHILLGWQTVSRIVPEAAYPIRMGGYSLNSDGHESDTDKNPSIFWDEVHITSPPKPKPEIDWSKVPENILVRVWDNEGDNHRVAEYHGYDTDLSPLHHWVKGTRSNFRYKHCELHESVTTLAEWYK